MMSAKKTPHKNHEQSSSPLVSFNIFFLLSFLALIITTAIYLKSLNNQFTNWDDSLYVTENANIKTLHGDSLNYTFKKIVSSYEQGNYHPLTMLSYCLEYEKFKLNPKPYHITNFILHLLNVLLVFYFIWLLTKQRWVAFITALLFAIHPMHVESVAWVSELKDVLYSFFYLAALCSYIFYLRKEKKKALFYTLTFLLFILAVLSKAMAVSLPIALFAVDYFIGRKFILKNGLEKLPFLFVSFTFGYIAILAQKSGSNALWDIGQYNFFDRIIFSSYGLMTYLWKLIVPINLSCFYNYPVKTDGLYPVIFYIAPVVMIALAFFIYQSKRFGKDVIFGFGFFIITIAMVLQIFPVGAAIIADRYTYLPYIGVFFIIAREMNNLLENKSEKYKSLKIPFIATFVLFVMMFCYLTFQRSKVWHDSIALWTDAIKKFDGNPIPFKNRAGAYLLAKQYDKAIADYSKVFELKFDIAESYNNRGDAYFLKEDYDKAVPDFSRAIQLKFITPDIYYKRGMAYYHLQKYNEAIKDFNDVIQLDSNFTDVNYSRGLAYYNFKKYDDAIKDYSIAIRKSSNSGKAYNDRGVAYDNLGKYNEAIQDYTDAIQHDPSFTKAYLNRGNAYYNHGKYNEAIQDYSSVIRLSPTSAQAYNNRAIAYYNIKKYQDALEDAIKANQLGFAVDPLFIEKLQNAGKK